MQDIIPQRNWTIHKVAWRDPDDNTEMYAILDPDGFGRLVGDRQDAWDLYWRLSKFLETGQDDGSIDEDDEALGWRWLTITEAEEYARDLALADRDVALGEGFNTRTIRLAAADGRLRAQKVGGIWKVELSDFRGWLKNEYRPRRVST